MAFDGTKERASASGQDPESDAGPIDEAARLRPSADPNELAHRHIHFLTKKARSLTGSRAAGDDLVQTTFVKALVAFPRFKPRSATHALLLERAWLARIMTHTFIDQLKKNSNAPGSLEDHPEPAAWPEPSEPWWKDFAIEDLEDAVQDLPKWLRETFELFYFERLDYAAIAERLNIKIGTVGGRLNRARNRIRKRMKSRTQSEHRESDP